MGNVEFHPAETPHKSAAAARSLAQAADFTFSFLPVEPNTTFPFRWRVRDAHDGRDLLSRCSADRAATFLDLVICDPLHRRYVEIPPVPDDLWAKRYSTEMRSKPFLLPAREEEEEDSQFRVIYNWVCIYKIITFLYNYSDTKKWVLPTSFSFLPDRKIRNPMNLVRHHEGYEGCHIIGAAEGCLLLVHYSVELIQYFIKDPKTFLVERFCKGKLPYIVDHAIPYARFPPPLSALSI